jgi:predicted DNA-binding protein (MmcQ/YjbR family)
MNQAEVEAFVTKLDNVQQEENFGYTFYFVGDDHRLPFVTIADSDNEYDSVSNLNREGVYRINIGVSKATFESLFADPIPADIDYSALDVFLPHPHYAKQHFVCILNPSQKNAEITKQLIVEAHSLAASRLQRRSRKPD